MNNVETMNDTVATSEVENGSQTNDTVENTIETGASTSTESTEVVKPAEAPAVPTVTKPISALNLSMTTLLSAFKGQPKSPTFQELMDKELGRYGWNFSQIGQNYQTVDPSKITEKVKNNTTSDYKPDQRELIVACVKLYRTIYVTRQMVIAVNLTRGQSSCPNYINCNANNLTNVEGLYKLPTHVLPEGLLDEINKDMAERAEAYRQRKLKEAEEAAAAKAKADAEKAEADRLKAEADAKAAEEAKANQPTEQSTQPAPAEPAKPSKKAKKGKKGKAEPVVETPAEMPVGEVLEAPHSDSTIETTSEAANEVKAPEEVESN